MGGQRKAVVIFCDQGYWRDLAQLVSDVFVDHVVDRLKVRAEQQIVSVPLLGQDVSGGDQSGRRGFILDHHSLAEPIAEFFRDKTGRNVGGAARAKADY